MQSDVVEDPLKLVTYPLQGELVLGWLVFKEVLAVEDCLDALDHCLHLGFDDRKVVDGVGACEGGERCCCNPTDKRDCWLDGSGCRSGGRYRLQRWRWQKLGLRDWREQGFAARD